MAETPRIKHKGTRVVNRPVGETSGTCFKNNFWNENTQQN